MTDLHQLDELLRAQEGDAGCDAGVPIMDQYVEIELRGEDPQRAIPRHRDPPAGLPGLPCRPRRGARGGPALRRPRPGVDRAVRPERPTGLISTTAPSHRPGAAPRGARP